jgi:hypothetical protein
LSDTKPCPRIRAGCNSRVDAGTSLMDMHTRKDSGPRTWMAPVNKERLTPESVETLQETIDCHEDPELSFCVGRPRSSSACAIRDLGVWRSPLVCSSRQIPCCGEYPRDCHRMSQMARRTIGSFPLRLGLSNVDDRALCREQAGFRGVLAQCMRLSPWTDWENRGAYCGGMARKLPKTRTNMKKLEAEMASVSKCRERRFVGGLHPCPLIARPGDVGRSRFQRGQAALTNQVLASLSLQHRTAHTRIVRCLGWQLPATERLEWMPIVGASHAANQFSEESAGCSRSGLAKTLWAANKTPGLWRLVSKTRDWLGDFGTLK